MSKGSEVTVRFAREYARAARHGVRASEPAATSARYDVRADRIVVELQSGIAFAIPARLIQGLAEATIATRRHVIVSGGGVGLYWPDLDLDIDVRRLVAGVFGNAVWMSALARLAGSKTSTAKARAARENGKRGGRPRKTALERRAG